MGRPINHKSHLVELPFRLTLTETARLIRVAPGFLSQMCMQGDGPSHRRLGREYVIARDALLCWITGLNIETAEGLFSGIDVIRDRIKETRVLMSGTTRVGTETPWMSDARSNDLKGGAGIAVTYGEDRVSR